jgi:cytochrome c oxidase cbb3-type subunit I/II
MMFAGIYYSTQRLVKARLASDFLSTLHFWGWQLIIVAAAITLPLGSPAARNTPSSSGPSTSPSRHLGGVRRELLLDPRAAPREVPLRRHLVLHRDDHHRGDALHRQSPLDPDQLLHSYPIFGGVQDGARAVVVWAQRRGVLPHHADPRHHVLLPAEGGGAAGVFLPALGDPFLVARLPLHLGRPAPPAQHRAARLAPEPRHDLLAHALGPLVGRHAQRPAHAPRRLAQAPHRSGLKFFAAAVTFYGMATFEGPLLSIKSVNALGTTPTGSSATCTPAPSAGTASWPPA